MRRWRIDGRKMEEREELSKRRRQKFREGKMMEKYIRWNNIKDIKSGRIGDR